jgi:hypothetical protein
LVSGQGEHVFAAEFRTRPADRSDAGPKRRPGSTTLLSASLAVEALLPELAVRHRLRPPSTVWHTVCLANRQRVPSSRP